MNVEEINVRFGRNYKWIYVKEEEKLYVSNGSRGEVKALKCLSFKEGCKARGKIVDGVFSRTNPYNHISCCQNHKSLRRKQLDHNYLKKKASLTSLQVRKIYRKKFER